MSNSNLDMPSFREGESIIFFEDRDTSSPQLLVVEKYDKNNKRYYFNGLYGDKDTIESNSDSLADLYELLEKSKTSSIIGGKTVRTPQQKTRQNEAPKIILSPMIIKKYFDNYPIFPYI